MPGANFSSLILADGWMSLFLPPPPTTSATFPFVLHLAVALSPGYCTRCARLGISGLWSPRGGQAG